jgi:hypothetical protein
MEVWIFFVTNTRIVIFVSKLTYYKVATMTTTAQRASRSRMTPLVLGAGAVIAAVLVNQVGISKTHVHAITSLYNCILTPVRHTLLTMRRLKLAV